MEELFFSENRICASESQSHNSPSIEWLEGDDIARETEVRAMLRDVLDARPWVSEYLAGHVEPDAAEHGPGDFDDDLAA